MFSTLLRIEQNGRRLFIQFFVYCPRIKITTATILFCFTQNIISKVKPGYVSMYFKPIMSSRGVSNAKIGYVMTNLVPRASFPLTSRRKTRALGATIYFEITKEIMEFCPSGSTQSACMSHA